MKYKSPRPGDEVYTAYWKKLVPLVVERSNFREGHLVTLDILCAMLSEKDNAQATLDIVGNYYESTGLIKPRPELLQINNLRKDITSYIKLLGITLTKDESRGNTKAEKDDWS